MLHVPVRRSLRLVAVGNPLGAVGLAPKESKNLEIPMTVSGTNGTTGRIGKDRRVDEWWFLALAPDHE